MTYPRRSVIAHRGFSHRYPENTLYAIRDVVATYRTAVAGIEIDVQLSGDGRIVMWHDEDLSRLGRADTLIRKTPHADLAALTRLHPHFKGESLALLDDVFAVTNHKTALYIEIKAYRYDHGTFANALAALLAGYAPAHDIVIHSFSADMLQRIIAATAGMNLRFGFLFSGMDALRAVEGAWLERVHYLHPVHTLLASNGDDIRSYGKPLNVWTPNSQAAVLTLHQSSAWPLVEGIITDNPELIGMLPPTGT
jgi:glycerophosphoryl diester phosphodiesterase